MSWDMRVGPPLTGPVDTLALQRAITPGAGRGGTGRGGPVTNATGGLGGPGGAAADTTGRGGAPGGGRGGGAPDNTFPAIPGKYIARLTISSPAGPPTVLEQSFALTKDPMVMLTRRGAEAALRVPSRRRENAALAARETGAARHGAATAGRGEACGRFGGHEGDSRAEDAARRGGKGARGHHA